MKNYLRLSFIFLRNNPISENNHLSKKKKKKKMTKKNIKNKMNKLFIKII